MAHDHSTEPQPADPGPSGLPGFLGKEPPGAAKGRTGTPAGIRILLMAGAILAVGFFLYREALVEEGRAVGSGGSMTDYDWQVVAPDGTPVDLATYKGRPVLLNVWATWCGPCLMEMPSLAALSKRPELKEAGVAVVLVSTDGDLESVQGFVDRFDTGDADVLVAAAMPPREFSTAGIPATFLIGPDGRIVRSEVGAMDWNTAEIAAELAALAGRK